jgi:hypothetical protein
VLFCHVGGANAFSLDFVSAYLAEFAKSAGEKKKAERPFNSRGQPGDLGAPDGVRFVF